MHLISNRTLFRIWGWMAAPLLLGAVWISFQTSLPLGIAFLSAVAFWLYDMGATTCSRCASYGTLQCGVQGKLIPLIFPRRSIRAVSPWRVKMHRAYDLLIIGFCIAMYSQVLWLLPIMLLWSVLGLCVVYGPGRHHGLLHTLRTSVRPPAATQHLVSLQQFNSPSNQDSEDLQNDG